MNDQNSQNTDDVEWEARMSEGLTALADRARHDPDLADTLRRRIGVRRRREAALLVAASAGVAVGAVWFAGAFTDPDTSPTSASSGAEEMSYTCPNSTPVTVLPSWARAGFSEPRPTMPYVLGDEGRIVAIVFGEPLVAPMSADHSNKVLWVAKSGSGALSIRARRHDSATPTVVDTYALGPSYLDLPSPGCWHLELSWGDQSDAMNILVQAP